MKTTKGERIAYDLMQLVDAHAAWSDKTFGTPAKRGPEGPLKHLAKEAIEALASPNDPLEYADCLLLILDASRRAGFDLETLLHATLAKLAVNKGRKWPKPTSDEPVEHSKAEELQNASCCKARIRSGISGELAGCVLPAGHTGWHATDHVVWPDGKPYLTEPRCGWYFDDATKVGSCRLPDCHSGSHNFISRHSAFSRPLDESDKLDEQIIQQAETDGLKPLPEPEPKLVITIPEEKFSCAICGQLSPADQLFQGHDQQGITVRICRKCYEAGSLEALMKPTKDMERKCGGCGKPALPGRYICQECLDNIPF